ncbi:MAG: Ni/Fe-hydrogenase cytochrome b subunit [Acidobacteriota bacterium]|nr:Ni/Fe-hydrogenase cytochrome b subunit [Blastocatellia bacterium]MDW8240607.1 Ni/Fe-hydrogenase cytochrome b subunit [Acidobacteriota bacterium]
MSRIKLPQLTFWRVVLVIILIAGLYSTVIRFTRGLGASTALSDQFPWGLWIGFDVLCGVALAAGGFTLSAVVYIFHVERFRPIVRPAILTAFLGYLLVIVALIYDLGKPYNIWHPLVMWNTRSVMFEVAWCVMLYTLVLALEFSPMVFERWQLQKPLKIIHALTIPLVIVGVILSMLHQSSLGSLFLIVPHKLHALWYSPLLPVFFFISAVALGCAMTIFESFLSFRAFGKRLELDLLADLGKVMVVVLGVYLVLKGQDLLERGAWELAFEPTYAGRMFLAENLLGIIAPIILLLIARIRNNDFGLFVSAVMVVLGFIMNRLNVSITGIEANAGIFYFPSWMEIAVTTMIVALGFVLFGLAVRYLPVFPMKEQLPAERVVPLPAAALLHPAKRRTAALVLALTVILGGSAIALAYSGLQHRSRLMTTTDTPSTQPEAQVVEHSLQLPADKEFPQHEDSPGPVTFSHTTHVDPTQPSCTVCHARTFRIIETHQAPLSVNMHDRQACGLCHDGERAFSINDGCTTCHRLP